MNWCKGMFWCCISMVWNNLIAFCFKLLELCLILFLEFFILVYCYYVGMVLLLFGLNFCLSVKMLVGVFIIFL